MPDKPVQPVLGGVGGHLTAFTALQALRSVPVAKPFKEELRADHARSIQDEGTRIGHALALPLAASLRMW